MIRRMFYDEAGCLIIKSYMLKDLSEIYGVSNNIFKRWLKPYENELGKRKGHFYNIQQVEFMISKFGLPRKVEEYIEDAA